MHITLVHLHIQEAHLNEFMEEVRRNHQASVKEPGNLRFDVLRSAEDPTRFLLYEAYTSAEAAAAHRQTPHFQRWQERVPAWFASERRADRYQGLLPENP